MIGRRTQLLLSLIYRLVYHFSPYTQSPIFAGETKSFGKSRLIEERVQVRFRDRLEAPSRSQNQTFTPESTIELQLEQKGIYEVQIAGDMKTVAVSADLRESSLNRIDNSAFKSTFVRSEQELLAWNEINLSPEERQESYLKTNLVLMLFLVIAEALLAFKLGYHPKKGSSHV